MGYAHETSTSEVQYPHTPKRTEAVAEAFKMLVDALAARRNSQMVLMMGSERETRKMRRNAMNVSMGGTNTSLGHINTGMNHEQPGMFACLPQDS